MNNKTYQYERIEIPNSSVLDSAEQFYDGAEFLRQLPPMSGVLLPMITNAALAIELYIKSLCVRSIIKDYKNFGNDVCGGRVIGEPLTKGHNLSSLLINIGNADKYNIGIKIKNNIESLYADGVIQYSFTELVELVKPYDNLFVEARYAYENDALSNLDITGLFHCLTTLRFTIQKITRIERVFK
ncbi:hypothetical protein IG521_13770 [Vibrio cholerae]|uniref:hypothetical protein n=1 Tax=Vibrio cholerae TaxID=666 RepID=UPI00226E9BEA|nr:hypothetical protein [Vibrio cholerae]EGR1835154.1 hypothetical protein [Vibrio cholerae]MCX9599506.1 hypothetical protein [Vibrio cholerae]